MEPGGDELVDIVRLRRVQYPRSRRAVTSAAPNYGARCWPKLADDEHWKWAGQPGVITDFFIRI